MGWLQRRGARLSAGTAGLSALLVALVVLLYRGIALEGGILPGYDLFTYFYPYRDAASAALRSLHLPLWNPDIFMGVPFLANIQTAVFYPPNLLWLWLDAPAATTASILLHVSLAGVFMLAFLRWGLGLRPLAAFFGGLTFSLGGFVSAQVGHPNQLAATAWLPLLLLVYELALRKRSLRWASVGAGMVALQALAGHPQELFVSLVTLALFAAARSLLIRERSLVGEGTAADAPGGTLLGRRLPHAAWGLALAVWMVGLGVGLAGVQLLPTLELTARSFRAGGLSYAEAASFSLPPQELLRGLLPTFGVPPFSEYTGYLGVIPLTVAVVAGVQWRPRYAALFGVLMALGLLLALGGYTPFFVHLHRWVPGFSSFRVPARWLLLYSFSGAVLAGVGLHRLAGGAAPSGCRLLLAAETLLGGFLLAGVGWPAVLGREVVWPETGVLIAFVGIFLVAMALTVLLRWRPSVRWVPLVLAAGAVGELLVAGSRLDLSHTVPPEAYDSVRPVLAELISRQGPHRVLSIASVDFEPGDRQDLMQAYEGLLSQREIADLIIAHKYKDLLAPNLGLTWGLASVDGYDGGLLPLRSYAEFQPLLLPAEDAAPHLRGASDAYPDALLRDLYSGLPNAELAGALGVKYVVSNKVRDVWLDNVYYDLSTSRVLFPGEELQLGRLPKLEGTELGVVSYVDGMADKPDAYPVAEVEVYAGDGLVASQTLRLGEDTAEGGFQGSGGPRAHARPRVASDALGETPGSVYHTLVPLSQPAAATAIRFRSVAEEGRFVLVGLTLIDGRTQAHLPVSVDPAYEVVYSGDLKVYRNLRYRPRAFIVRRYEVEPDPEAAVEVLRRDMLGTAVLPREPDATVAAALARAELTDRPGADEVELLAAEKERTLYRVQLSAPGLLVVTDAYYPGWNAYVDGERVPLLQADVMFRAVALRRGSHRVEFVYDPLSLRVGATLSVVSGLVLVGGVVAGVLWRPGRSSAG